MKHQSKRIACLIGALAAILADLVVPCGPVAQAQFVVTSPAKIARPASAPPASIEASESEGDEAPPPDMGAVMPVQGAPAGGATIASVALSPQEVADLKAVYDSLPADRQAQMKAYYADLGVNLDVALGLTSAMSAEAQRTQMLLESMKQLDFSRRPQAVLAARSKLGFGQVAQPSASTASPQDLAKWIHLQVMAGEWQALGEYLKTRPAAEAQGVYSQILQSMNRGDPGLLPEEVLALAEASPGELKDWQLTSLASLARLAADKSSAGPMLAQIKAGTRLFGPQDPEHRRRTVDFLAGAGMVVQAYDYLPPLEEARAAHDGPVMLVHARYKERLASENAPGADPDACRVAAWALFAEASMLPGASFEVRRDAISRGIGLMNQVPRSQVTPWLESIFASDTLGPTALELMALKAATIGDEKLDVAQRAQAILTMKEAVDVLLARPSVETSSLRVPMRMLTTALLSEMESTVKDKARQQVMTREAQLLLRAIPSRKWFDALEPSLATRASKACIAIATVADETDIALGLLSDGIARSPDQATALADHFLGFWEQRLNPQPEADESQGMFYFYREYIPQAPLTRGRQRRNLDRLHRLMDTLAAIGVEPRTLPSIAAAFKACHSRTEVFERDEIIRVFGPMEKIPAATATALAETMGASLNGDWRNRAAQQATGTKRSDSEIAALVDKGYGVALELIESALSQHADSWRNAMIKAGLSYDRMQFKNAQQKQDPATLNAYRKASFEAFEQAAGQYAAALASGQERENADVFIRWFGAALGTPELNFLRVDEMPTEGTLQDDQITRIGKAIAALPEDAAFRHIGAFAQAVSAAVGRSDPEVKPRLVHHAMRIIGDHPAGASLRALEELYRDLVKDEIKLRLAIDGPDSVGVGKPFAMLVSLRFTNAVDRETGGFGKYLQNNVWGRVGREYREINYRDQFQKQIETALGKAFTIETVGFFDPFMPPRGVTEDGQDGWLEKPMAYVIATRKDPSVDRVPQVIVDMQFNDQTGPVTLALPSNTPPLAVGDGRAARPCGEFAVSQIIDVRDAQTGDKDKAIKLEVQFRGNGVVPDLREALAGIDTAIDGYEIASDGVEAKPTVILEEGATPSSRFYFGPPQPPKNGYPEPDASGMYRLNVERTWVVTYKPKGSAQGGSFRVPTLNSGVDAKIESRWYTDMDLVPVVGGIIPVTARWSNGMKIAVILVSALALGAVLVLLLRRRQAEPLPAGGFLPPERLTPLSVIMALRRFQAQHAPGLDTARREAMDQEIAALERTYFGPQSRSTYDGDLAAILNRWTSGSPAAPGRRP